ncbi:unnamed protein product, partial [Hapterophycus canaliculatus]
QVLDTRQTFLNLCQGNHYQFDMLRRAKHSSMMVSQARLVTQTSHTHLGLGLGPGLTSCAVRPPYTLLSRTY